MPVPKAQAIRVWSRAFSTTILSCLALVIATSGCTPKAPQGLPGSEASVRTSDLTLSIAGGNGQSVVVANDFNGYLVAFVRNSQGESVSGVSVDWSVVSGSASILLSSASSLNLDGTSAVNVSAGTVSGPIVIKASIAGTSTSVTYHLTSVSDIPASIAISSGNSQTRTVARTLASPLVAIVRDQYGNVVPNATVDWTVTAQGGSMSAASSTTNTSGMASSNLTLGTLVGTAGVSATVRGTPFTTSFTATATADVPASIAVSSGDNQSGPRNANLPSPIVVLVKDQYGNVTPGITVNWAATSGGGSFSPASSTTNASGLASSTWKMGLVRGANTGKATVNATAISVTFNGTGLPIAFTQNWPFDQSGAASNYTFSTTKVDFTGGTAKLKTVDQTDDDSTSAGFGGGSFSGVMWDSVNSQLKLGNFGGCDGASTNCSAVSGSALSGTFTSRVIDVGESATSASWLSMLWQTAYPFGKELPDSASSETATDYPSIGGGLMSGNVALWHFNETAANSVSGGTDVADSSGTNNHGTDNTGSAVTYNQPGILKTSLHFNGTGRMGFQTLSLPSGSVDRSVSLWFKKDGAGDQGLFSYGSTFGTDRVFEIAVVGGDLVFSSQTSDTSATSIPVSTGVWHLATVTYDGSNIRVYLDGALYVTRAFALDTTTGSRRIGDGLINGNFVGSIDEVAMWSRALSGAEVSEIYRRGASHLKVQVRTCAMSNCSDGTFVGSNGTGSTYFSEINNSALTKPSMTFSDFGVALTGRRYFQYRVVFDSIHNNAASGPTLKNVTVGPNHYDGSNPTINNILTVDYATLATFTETLGAAGCTSGVRYVVSSDNATWYYWTGAAWATSDSTYTKASPATTINSNISTFSATAGIGNFYWKLFLKSDGTDQCEITNLTVTGTN